MDWTRPVAGELLAAWRLPIVVPTSTAPDQAAALLAAQERRRIDKAGGMVSKLVNREGRHVGPYRVFGPGGTSPGLAMARSLGDLVAHQLGVTPQPTCTTRALTSADQFVVRSSRHLGLSSSIGQSVPAVSWGV